MTDAVSELIKNIASKGDWAVALAAGISGFCLDAWLDIVPQANFPPSICALVAVGIGLAIKRTVEAIRERSRDRILMQLAVAEAERIAEELGLNGETRAAAELNYELTSAQAGDGLPALRDAIRAARTQLPKTAMPAKLSERGRQEIRLEDQ